MKHQTSALILLAGLSLCGIQAHAQPGQEGQARPRQGQGQGRGQGWGQGGRGGAMITPQQIQQMREEAMKAQMTELAIPEATQTAIIAYAAARESAATPLRVQARTLQQGLANNLSAEVATRQLTALREAVRLEKERRATAQAALDTEIGFSKSPQLEAYLTLAGLIGDEGAILSAPGVGGGRGGFGGGRGGQGGGRGGRGGGQPGGAGGGPNGGDAPV